MVGHGAVASDDQVEVTGNSLLGITAQEVAQVEANKVCTVRTRKGGEAVEIQIPCTN